MTSAGFDSRYPTSVAPSCVLGRSDILRSLSQVPVIPLSTRARGLEWEVHLGQPDGLPDASVLKPEWIRSVERTLLGPWIASLPEKRWPEVRAAILNVLGLSQE